MKCDYCGRYDTYDGHGGCLTCGAPIKPRREDYACHHDYASSSLSTAVVVHRHEREPITRKKVTLAI